MTNKQYLAEREEAQLRAITESADRKLGNDYKSRNQINPHRPRRTKSDYDPMEW